jgi:ferredoxin
LSATLYYFTGTGNSLWVARKLVEKLPQASLIPVVKALNEKDVSPDTDTVGFIIPLYFCGIPDIVRRFIEKVDLNQTEYLFTVVTRGLTSGLVFELMDELLKKKSKKLGSAFYLTMPDNYIPNITPPPPSKIPKIMTDASSGIDKIAQAVLEKKETNPRDPWFWKLLGKTYYSSWVRDVHSRDKSFNVTDDCNSCGICQKVCPVANVTLSGGKPSWQHQCEQCMACIELCPQEAIQFEKKTLKRARYHHPEVTVKDIISQKG